MQLRTAPLYSNAPVYFALLLMVALAGFYPSNYGGFGEARAVHHVHDALAALWMLLLIGQGWLIRIRQLGMHRLVGRCSIVLVVLFVVSGLMVVRDTLAGDGDTQVDLRLAFLDLSSVLFFAFAYCMAIYYRRNMALHARFMVCTALPLLAPALARALGRYVLAPDAGFGQALNIAYGISALIVVALLAHDARTGKLRAPYLLLLALLLVQQGSLGLAPDSGPWRALVASLVS